MRLILRGIMVLLCLGSFSVVYAQSLLEGAVGIWLFDEGSGDTAKDSSGNENHGTLHGGKWVKGQFNTALQFNGVNEFVEVPDSDSLDLEDQVTMLCWFWWAGSGDAWQTFFSKGPMAGPNENYAFFINSGNRHTHFVINAGGRTFQNSPNNAFEPEKWYHAAAVYDGKQMITYVNGEEVASQPHSGKLVPNDNYLGIGYREGSPHWWNGILDDMAVFNRALSQEEIQQIMENGLKAAASVQPQGKLALTWGAVKSR